MPLEVTSLEREFTFKKDSKTTIDLADPNPSMSVDDVIKFYSGEHPELTNAMVQGPTVVGDKANYSITTKAGKLG